MKYLTGLVAFVCAITATPAALALRCSTSLIHEGDLAIQVRQHCGDPASEELIGYTLRPARIAEGSAVAYERELRIEQWVYGPDSGYYNVLTFEGGRLKRIERLRD